MIMLSQTSLKLVAMVTRHYSTPLRGNVSGKESLKTLVSTLTLFVSRNAEHYINLSFSLIPYTCFAGFFVRGIGVDGALGFLFYLCGVVCLFGSLF